MDECHDSGTNKQTANKERLGYSANRLWKAEMSNSATIILLLLLILALFTLRSSNPLNSKISQFTFPILQFTFQIPNSCLKFSHYHLVVDCNSNSFCSAFEQNTQFGNIFQFTFQVPIFSFGAEHRTDNSFLIEQKSSSW